MVKGWEFEVWPLLACGVVIDGKRPLLMGCDVVSSDYV